MIDIWNWGLKRMGKKTQSVITFLVCQLGPKTSAGRRCARLSCGGKTEYLTVVRSKYFWVPLRGHTAGPQPGDCHPLPGSTSVTYAGDLQASVGISSSSLASCRSEAIKTVDFVIIILIIIMPRKTLQMCWYQAHSFKFTLVVACLNFVTGNTQNIKGGSCIVRFCFSVLFIFYLQIVAQE